MGFPRNGFPEALGLLYDHLDPDLNGTGGTPAGTGVTAELDGLSVLRQTVIRFTNTPVTLADNAGVVAFGGLKVFDFPAGAIKIHGALANIAVTKSSAGVIDAFDGDFSVGTATAGNDAALSGTEANIIASTATPQATAGATTARGFGGTDLTVDGTSSAVDLFVNFLVDDTDHDVTATPANLVLNGTLTVFWTNLGDY